MRLVSSDLSIKVQYSINILQLSFFSNQIEPKIQHIEEDCKVRLCSSSQQLPLGMYNISNAIVSSRESNLSRKMCNLSAVPVQ